MGLGILLGNRVLGGFYLGCDQALAGKPPVAPGARDGRLVRHSDKVDISWESFGLTYLELKGITPAMTRKRTNPDFLNGVPELLILRLLSRRSMYGYEIVQEIKQSTDQVLEFGEGCIYPLLHKLEAQKLLTCEKSVVGGRKRVTYRTSAAGKKRMAASEAHWRRIVAAIGGVLEGATHGRPELA